MPRETEQDSPEKSGETRRERIATEVLKSLLLDLRRQGSCEAYAKDAVQFADALTAELDK